VSQVIIPPGVTSVSVTNFPATQSVSGTVAVSALPALPAGANQIGTTLGPALTKGTQGATGYSTQDLKDSGRNAVLYSMAAPANATATETLLSLAGWKSNAAVGATTTPAVVTTGKTLRLTSVFLMYVSATTAGTARLALRANTGGVVAVSSPVVVQWVIGVSAPTTSGASFMASVPLPDGLEFAAGTGIGVSIIGLSPAGGALATGNGGITIHGFEY
jgi:hypothetical protein